MRWRGLCVQWDTHPMLITEQGQGEHVGEFHTSTESTFPSRRSHLPGRISCKLHIARDDSNVLSTVDRYS